jgi:hypothetical protein
MRANVCVLVYLSIAEIFRLLTLIKLALIYTACLRPRCVHFLPLVGCCASTLVRACPCIVKAGMHICTSLLYLHPFYGHHASNFI